MTLPVVVGAMDRPGFQATGLYVEGDSLLHRLDVRLKLGVLLVAIMSLFASPSPYRLLLISGLCVCAVVSSNLRIAQVGKKLLGLRWLLLFSLLLHLFFTPGRTMFGTTWLSYDGLLRGLTVDLQLLLALLCSYLLALTTAPTSLAWGMGTLLSPLARLGVPVREGSGLMLLVLHFVPLVRDEVTLLKEKQSAASFLGRVGTAAGLIGPLILRLVDRADDLAHQIVADGTSLGSAESVRDNRFGTHDYWTIFLGVPVLILLWVL